MASPDSANLPDAVPSNFHSADLKGATNGRQALCNEAICSVGTFRPANSVRPHDGAGNPPLSLDFESFDPLAAHKLVASAREVVVPQAVPEAKDKIDRIIDAAQWSPSTKITMALQELGDKSHNVPTVLVRANGKVEYSGNVDELLKTPGSEIFVELERKQGQLNPTDKQFKAVHELAGELANKIHDKQSATAVITLDDRDNVVKSEDKLCLGLRSPDVRFRTSDETRDVIRTLHRTKGIDGMDMPRAQTREFALFETRKVRQLPHETLHDMQQKESVAALFHPDKAKPYETAKMHPQGDIRVGRYGLSGDQIKSYVENLGEPPAQALIQDQIKSGRLSAEYAAKLSQPEFRQRLISMADELKQGIYPAPTTLDSLLPKQAQEQMALSLIDGYKARGLKDEGSVTSAMLSGIPPAKLEAKDLDSEESHELAEAGQKLYRMARAWQFSDQWRSDKTVGKIPVGERHELIETALMLAKVPVNEANVRSVDLIVQHESSWNARAINNWDLNARHNNHSKGLMQTIGSTFRKHALPGHDDIFNPVDNMAAGIRYAVVRYGSLDDVPGIRAKKRGHSYKGY